MKGTFKVYLHLILDCGSTITDSTGTIVSPLYPDTIQGPVECEWNIEGKAGEIITLDTKQFRLGFGNSCGRGTLEVRDRINEPLIGSYCGIGSVTPRKIRSHSNHMYLKYITAGAFRGERFKLDFVKGKI